STETNFEGLEWDFYETCNEDHGRKEARRYWIISSLEGLQEIQEWKAVNLIGMVESEVVIGGQSSTEIRYYISSLKGNAEAFAKAVRSHWGIENSVHWILDEAFREDDCRIRMGNAAENLSILRRLAMNLIKQEKSSRVGVKAKRMKAGWDHSYLLKILTLKT